MGQGDFPGLGRADVNIGGSAGGLDAFQLGLSGVGQKAQLGDAQLGQVRELQRRILAQQILDQGRLAGGDIVLGGQLLQGLIL